MEKLSASFRPTPFQSSIFKGIPKIELIFENCSRYRVTAINDEGWYRKQCRFSESAPSWGEFYHITGDTLDHLDATPWSNLNGSGNYHFHFYLRDETLEVKATGWSVQEAV